MAGLLRIARAVVLIGFLASALGLAAVTVVAFPGAWSSPGSWSSYDAAELISLVGSALFYLLFGAAFWVWLPKLDRGGGAASIAPLGLRLLAAASLLLAVAYSAETYQLVRFFSVNTLQGHSWRSDRIGACAGYGVMALGFGVGAIGFWAGSLVFGGSLDDADDPPSTSTGSQLVVPPRMRVQASVIGAGLVAGSIGVLVSVWPHRISYTGAIAKSQVIFGCANALALVVMAAGFGALLVGRNGVAGRSSMRTPLALLALAFLALAASNLAVAYQAFHVFAQSHDWDTRTGCVLQCAGSLTAAVGFLAAARSAPTGQPVPVDPSPVAGQPELVAAH